MYTLHIVLPTQEKTPLEGILNSFHVVRQAQERSDTFIFIP